MIATKALFMFICIGVCAGFPTNMQGYWQGIPEVTPLGPWNSLFNFTILPLQNSTNEWLLSDFYSEEGVNIPGTEQQWWIEDGVGMTYCGVVYNFFRVPGTVIRNFTESFQTDTQIQWCNHGCDKLAWTLTLLDENTLQSLFYYADPVKHLNVTLTRVNTPVPRYLSIPMKPPCNFTVEIQTPEEKNNEDTFVDDKKIMGGCPFKHLHAPKIESSNEGRKLKKLPKRIQEEYQYCYILNEPLEYAVAWNFLESESKLQVAVSIPSDDPKSHYLGFGFQPKFPGMFNADVVMGYMGSAGNCVRSMYVPYYVGPPMNDDSMPLTDTDVIISGDRLTVQFTRDFDSGHHNITVTDPYDIPGVYAFQIMWAVGTAPSSCNASPEYHGNNRGLRYIDWYNPSSIFPDFMKCSY